MFRMQKFGLFKDSETPTWLGLKYVLLVIILHVIREGQALICGWERDYYPEGKTEEV